jgi:hypothetical protein
MSRIKEALLLCVPTGFDLAATTLMNVGLLYVAASGGVGDHWQARVWYPSQTVIHALCRCNVPESACASQPPLRTVRGHLCVLIQPEPSRQC